MTTTGVGKSIIAYCGLYCGACKSYMKGKCHGCHENEKATWCKVRKCCIENSYGSCADCQIVGDLRECKKLNNFISKLFALVFRSDRLACLELIKEIGYDEYAREMAEKGIMSVKR
ncbi:MAG TPA: DUF3795 domain-containing protein [bacterium]|nr:DUF3795 domain-containing protein [bacterium]